MLNPQAKEGDTKSSEAAGLITAPADTTVKRIKSQDLFQQMNALEIDHDGRIYRLRVTQFNKLVLTA